MGSHQSGSCFSSLLQWWKVYQPPFLFPYNVPLVLLPSAPPSGSNKPLLATPTLSHYSLFTRNVHIYCILSCFIYQVLQSLFIVAASLLTPTHLSASVIASARVQFDYLLSVLMPSPCSVL